MGLGEPLPGSRCLRAAWSAQGARSNKWRCLPSASSDEAFPCASSSSTRAIPWSRRCGGPECPSRCSTRRGAEAIDGDLPAFGLCEPRSSRPCHTVQAAVAAFLIETHFVALH